ncbi:ABC transporter ATP-binding protein [bacterium]|nr:ABC transporter ATP-binding protein [bacterium]
MSVTVENLTVRYGRLTAVDGLSVVFPPGSTGLLGPNGAGKSSLIKALLSLVTVESGTAAIFGRDVISEKKAIRQIVGYMPEDDCLIPGLTGIGMVQYAGELCGMNRRDAMQRAHEVLFMTGLEEARYRKVETYSSGMKQRIKLAQAIVHDPKLLFLDEPTSGMDPRGRQEMLDLIRTIASGGSMSIIVATHILIDVERTCERAVIMHRGTIRKQENIQDLQGRYSGTFSVRVEGDRAAFESFLKEHGCDIIPDGQHLIDVTLPEGADTDLIFTAAQRKNALLRRLVPSVQSLEDVFVKLIKEDSHADL